MNLTRVDASATTGHSALHRCSPVAKLIAFAVVLVGVMVTTNLLIVITLLLLLVAVGSLLRLPMRPMLALAAYPGLFAALFAFAAGVGWLAGALVVGKAITAALAAVVLMFTTPYPQVFAPIQRILPAVIADSLLMTYRSLFLLMEKFGHTLTAARLRAGIAGTQPLRAAGTITRSLGGVLLYSIDLSQRTHDIMYLRGYDGRLAVTPQRATSRGGDILLVVLAGAITLLATAWRIWWPALNPFAWIPLFAAAAFLAVSAITAFIRKDPS